MNRQEEVLQANCVMWFHNNYHKHRRMLHCNNNNSENAVKGALNKSMGVVDGVSDLELIVDNAVIFIEMKTATGTQSDEQKDFMKKVMARGHMYFIVRSLGEFKELVIKFLGE